MTLQIDVGPTYLIADPETAEIFTLKVNWRGHVKNNLTDISESIFDPIVTNNWFNPQQNRRGQKQFFF